MEYNTLESSNTCQMEYNTLESSNTCIKWNTIH